MQERLKALEDKLHSLTESEAEGTEKVDILLSMATAIGSNDAQRVRRLGKEAHDLAKQLNYRKGQVIGLGCMGFAAYIESDHESALTLYKSALNVAKTTDDLDGKAFVLSRMALLQMSLGDYEGSLNNGLEALKIARQTGDISSLATALMVCGICYSDLGSFDRSLRCYEEIQTILDDGVEDVYKGRAMSGMGTVYQKKGEYERALTFHKRSLVLFRDIGNRLGEARSLNDLGIVNAHLGNVEAALEFHQQSLRLREEVGHRQSQSTSLIHIGNLYLERGDMELAIDHLTRAFEIAESVTVHLRIYQAHLGLANAFERQGNLAAALDHHKKFHRVREEVMGEEARIRLNNMQIRFEVEKSEQAAEIERLRNVELKAKNDELRRVLQELRTMQAQLVHSEKLASLGQLTAGIAHEIMNPLNFVNNFAELTDSLAQELREVLENGEDVSELIEDLEQNVRLISLHGKRADGIVKSMMQHASIGKGQIRITDVNTLVSRHIDLALRGKSTENPEFNVEIEKVLDENTGLIEMVPEEIGRVILNLLGNAFDAVHERRTSQDQDYTPIVTVSTRQVKGLVEIRVSDNGPGIPLEIKEKIFEPFFTTKPSGKGTGLGLSLSYDIVTQGHGGMLTVESKKGKGATFIVKLPVKDNLPPTQALL